MISSFRTIDAPNQLSIEYKNLYAINGHIYYLTTEDIKLPYVNKFTNMYEFAPHIMKFTTEEQIENYLNTFTKRENIKLAALADNIWYGNIGHGLWDGLYPIYLALVKFGYINDDFTVLFGGFRNKETLAYQATKRFTGSEVLDYQKLDEYTFFHFETLVAGTGSTGNRVINKEYTVYGEKEYNALSFFKNRMLLRHGLMYDKPLNKKLKAIIVKNKRYSEEETQALKQVVDHYKDKLDIRYIDWYHEYRSFEDQMKEIEDVDIHISGPGTGMLYMPFLKKGAVNINLGYIEAIQTNTARPNLKIEQSDREDIFIPGWMEQSVCSAANYVSTFYYDRFKYPTIEFEPLVELLEKAMLQVGKQQENNLNLDAVVFKEYCKRCPNPEELCTYITGIAFFIELFVNEHPKTLSGCYVDIDLLRQIKQEYQFDEKYRITL